MIFSEKEIHRDVGDAMEKTHCCLKNRYKYPTAKKKMSLGKNNSLTASDKCFRA